MVAPLNWGLGHASRCVPIINELIKNGFEPILASDGVALELLQKEFPYLKAIELPSYNISYPKKGSFHWYFIKKLPHVIQTYIGEQQHIKAIVAQEQIDGIISDNRFGIWHHHIPSVYITHQLKVLSGFTTFISTFLHRFIIHKFDECWVPDDENKSYSGILSCNKKIKIKVKYLNILSRFSSLKTSQVYDLSIVLSGPEPQRTLLENQLLAELKKFTGTVCFVRGLPFETEFNEPIEGVTFFNFLSSNELNKVLNQSKLVLARSGYSTIMDLAILGKKAFFIPTPRQTEQEYLALYYQQKGIVPYCHQHEFSLDQLKKVNNFTGFNKVKQDFPTKLFEIFR